jgi:hypothetical protein
MTDTVDPPPGSRPDHAALSVSDAAISVYTLGRQARDFDGAGWQPPLQATLTGI